MGLRQQNSPSPGHDAYPGRHRGNDALRGLAILAVVVTHTTAEWAAFPPGHPAAVLHGKFRPALEIWIPWFLIVSGYYVGRESAGSWATYGTYLARRVKRILPPYLLWATMLFAVGVAGGVWHVSEYAVGMVNGRFAYPYYFLSVLIKLYLAYPVFLWALDTPARALFSLVGAGGLWFYGCLPDDPLGLRSAFLAEVLFRRTVHVEWAIFFMLGIFFRRRLRRASHPPETPDWVPATVVIGSGSVIAGAGLVGYGRILPGHAVGILGVLVFLAINTPLGERIAARARLLSGLGVCSYSIYLLHEPWLQWSKNLIGATATEHPLLAQVPLVAAALGVPLAIRYVAGSFLGPRATWVTG